MIFAIGLALAADLRPVRLGETVESLADGDPARAAEIRALNGLGPAAQPAVGAIVEIPPPAGDHGDQQAFLVRLSGSATSTTSAGVEAAAAPWIPLGPGTTVCTAANSYATLRLASACNEDGSTSDEIALHPDTCVAVDAAFSTTTRRSTVVRVTRGSVAVGEVAGGLGHVTVVTASGVTTGAKGGFRVTVEPAAARTEALTAPVAVQGAGQEVALAAGQGSRVKTGEAPSPAVDLLVTRSLTEPGAGDLLRRPTFAWEPVPEALGYRLEIASDLQFAGLIFQEDVPAATYTASTLMLPYDGRTTLQWRVSSFDRLGFLGVPSAPRALRIPPAP